jgi:hypothetical protein
MNELEMKERVMRVPALVRKLVIVFLAFHLSVRGSRGTGSWPVWSFVFARGSLIVFVYH